MKFGIGIPNSREGIFFPIDFAGPKEIAEVAQKAERLGFDSAWATDFITPTRSLGFIDGKAPNWYEVIVTLSYIAALTSRIRLAAGVLVLPYRDPVILAKQVASLDAFSGGRFMMGIGLGNRPEFEAIRPRAKDFHRGRLQDEMIESLILLLNNDAASFHGEYCEFKEVVIKPQPVQKPFPIYISGHNPETPRRVAQQGAGWILTTANPKMTIASSLEELYPEMEKIGRDPSEVQIIGTGYMSIATTRERAVERFRHSILAARSANVDAAMARHFVGTPSELIERIASLAKEGMTYCVPTSIAANTYGEMLEQVQMFGEEVLPALKHL